MMKTGKTTCLAPFQTEPGRPHPLGATVDKEGVKFSVFSRDATAVELLLFNLKGFANEIYYHLVEHDRQYYMDYSGCGNTVNCNHPIVVTIALGIVGAVGGGFIGAQLGFGDISGFNIRSMLLTVGGGALVLFVYGLVTKARA